MLVKDLEKIAVKSETTIKRMRNSIVRHLDKASNEHFEAGRIWYAEANQEAVDLANQTGYSVEQVAAAISHLSPRLHWGRTLRAAKELVHTGDANAVLGRQIRAAKSALESDNPIETFSATAHKTRSFYFNLIGDMDYVTVDVWAARAASIDEKVLGRVGMYQATAHAYKLAARTADISPAETQATVWAAVRGRAD